MKEKLVKSISLSSITVSDLKKAKHLFVDVLGLDLKEYHEEYKWMELAGNNDSVARLGIGQPPTDSNDDEIKIGHNAIVSFEVENIDKAKKHLQSNEVDCGEIMEIPGEVKLALFEDHDGNQYFLAEKLR